MTAIVLRVSRIGLWIISLAFGSVGTIYGYLIIVGLPIHRLDNIGHAALCLALASGLVYALRWIET